MGNLRMKTNMLVGYAKSADMLLGLTPGDELKVPRVWLEELLKYALAVDVCLEKTVDGSG